MKKKKQTEPLTLDTSIHRLNHCPWLYDRLHEIYWSGRIYGFDQYDLTDYQKQDLDILYLLEEFGFSLNETGTFLYKEMIAEAINKLSTATDRESKEIIYQQMQQPFSQFYVDVARNNLDMGIKTYHSFVSLSYRHREKDCINRRLAREMKLNTQEENYAHQAYKIANYYIRTKQNQETILIPETTEKQRTIKY